MIVKDEGHIIENKLNKLYNKVKFDYYVISDTGSSDNTKELMLKFFNDKNIKGEIYDDKWQDFGTNRTIALQHAYKKSEYLLIFDADDEIHGNFVLPDNLTYDRYNLKIGTGFEYYRPLLLNNSRKWKFVGVLHEFLSSDEKNLNEFTINGDYYIMSGREGNRSQNKDKYINDARILEDAYYKCKDIDVSLANRYAFYCAQSYKDSGPLHKDKAIEWYKKVLTLQTWEQEKYYSCMMLGEIVKDKFDQIYYFQKSIEYDSERIEGIVSACEIAYENGMHSIVDALYNTYKNHLLPTSSKLFIDTTLYRNVLDFYCSISSYYLNKLEQGYSICKKIILSNNVSDSRLERTFKNLHFFKDYIPKEDFELLFNKLNSYMQRIKSSFHKHLFSKELFDTWDFMFDLHKNSLIKYKNVDIKNKSSPKLLLSFTTCKRIDLFKQTVNSLLNNIIDVDTIDYWFCVDDNSDVIDRDEMKKLYPWIDYYMKTPNEKGHRKSMNIIYEKIVSLQPDYWFHLEDDFLFFDKVNISDIVNDLIKLSEYNIKQILLNLNYAETIKDYNIQGEIPLIDYNISIHNHVKGNFNYGNNHYWPNYSFRPSIIDVKAIIELGNFDTDNQFFEMDYASKYTKQGFKSAFLKKIVCKHIGKLTSQTNSDCKNAYALNSENQFASKKNHIKVVNLERREDRKVNTVSKLHSADINKFDIFKAIDGSLLEKDFKDAELFIGNDFGSKRGVIGCALSHYYLWKELIEDVDNDYYIIFEDDFDYSDTFKQQYENIYNRLNEKELVFLGYSMFEKSRQPVKEIYNNNNINVLIEPLNKDLYIGGTFGYSINKIGAKKLIDYINNNGIKHGIDYLIKITPNLNCYETKPHLLFSDWNENGKAIDSDIQNIFNPIELPVINTNDQYEFFKGYDQNGFDKLFNSNKKTVENIVSKSNDIAGYNTLGFIKTGVIFLSKSKYFSDNDGIFINKDYLQNMGYNIRDPPRHIEHLSMSYKPGNFCFIHSCNLNNNLEILEYLVDYISVNGKTKAFEKIFIINIGIPIENNKFTDDNIVIINLSQDPNLFELKTINLISSFSSNNPNSKILYLHTKGITYNNHNNVRDWVNLMLYFLVKRCSTSIKELDTYDAVGCNYNDTAEIGRHFSGNFWWATTNYIKQLPLIKGNNRHSAETWLLSNDSCNYKSLHDSNINHYQNSYTKNNYESNRIKMIGHWCDSRQLCEEWKHMTNNNSYKWNNLEITWEDTDIDYYVIVNYPNNNEYYEPSKTIVFQMEPWVHDTSKNWGVRTWNKWSIPNEDEFLCVIGRHSNTYNNVFWQFQLTPEELTNLKYEKIDKLSTVSSNKYFDEGHIARIDFIKYLDAKPDIPFNIFGNVQKFNFTNYSGELIHSEKHKGLVPYKYYFMVENNYEKDFITEKLWEPILCECLVFYYGCPNVKEYIDERAIVILDMNDFEKSYNVIKTAFEEDWWSQKIQYIKKEKEKLLNQMAFFPRIHSIIQNSIH